MCGVTLVSKIMSESDNTNFSQENKITFINKFVCKITIN